MPTGSNRDEEGAAPPAAAAAPGLGTIPPELVDALKAIEAEIRAAPATDPADLAPNTDAAAAAAATAAPEPAPTSTAQTDPGSDDAVSSPAAENAAEPPPSPFQIDGRPLQSAKDVADFLGESHSLLTYILYRAPKESRYYHFEIPKRTGGMRKISAPNPALRRWQDKLNPLLQAAYRVHPASHGFIHGRSAVSNANEHIGRRLVLNVDLRDFFPSINFGRIRGLFMAPPFALGAAAATVLAQIVTENNGLPQGAPTSPVLSNYIASTLDRRLMRLARENRLHYSRYADDITFSTDQPLFPAAVAHIEPAPPGAEKAAPLVRVGPALAYAIEASGFAINEKKLRLQGPHVRQSVTGITVNEKANIERTRVRRLRAMLHAWEKFGLEDAAREHLLRYRHAPQIAFSQQAPARFRSAVYGELAYLKMVRGQDDPLFLKLCGRIADIDPNPSKFIRQMLFGANDFDIFISHATEDKPGVARPIHAACEQRGLKAFLDEEHIAWGENFTKKINTALGAARTILAIVSSHSVAKAWPVAEVNAALDLEIMGKKRVLVVMVGKPDLSALPLIGAKSYHIWDGDADKVAEKLKASIEGARKPQRTSAAPGDEEADSDEPAPAVWPFPTAAAPGNKKRGWWPFG
jgi:RNA-directed DNA polymerase